MLPVITGERIVRIAFACQKAAAIDAARRLDGGSMTFQEQLAAACEEYAVKYNYKPTERARGFEAFVLHLSATDGGFLADPTVVGDPMHADLADYILRQNDGGVDGYLEDESNKIVLLIQAKYLTGKSKVNDDQLKAFLNIPTAMSEPDATKYLASLSTQARGVLAPLGERMKDGWSIVLRFMCNKPTTDRLEAITSATEAGHVQAGRKVKCEYVGQDSLKAIWTEATSGKSGLPGPVSFKLQQKKFMEIQDPRSTLVAVISGNELRNLFLQHRNLLFAQNIRLPLLSSTRINPEIAETATQSPKDFFYYNNGVSALCSHFTEDAGQVQAWDLQIINGAQTVGTLGDIPALPKEVSVLFRLSTAKTDEISFRDSITRTNNTQNEVVPWDFRANDPIQKFLEGALTRYSGQGPIPQFWYKRKRGLIAGGKGGRALEPEYLGKLRHAWLHGPVQSYKEPKRLASTQDGTGLYPEAFGDGQVIPKAWSKAELDEAMLAYSLDAYFISKADEYKKQQHAYARWLKRMSRYLVGVFGELSRTTPALKIDAKTWLLQADNEFASRVDPILKAAMSKINGRYNELKDLRVQPEYDIARDQDEFKRLCEGLQADLTA